MLFNSYIYVLFFTGVLAAYWLLPHRAQNRLLLVASLVFYGTWNWKFLGLLFLSTGLDYVSALRIERGAAAHRKKWLLASLIGNLSILGIFKYYNFFAENVSALFAALGWQASWPLLNIILPVGISFYTFQTMGYTIDVYRGKFKAVTSPAELALFVSFFPQLVAGPIERASDLIPQIRQPRCFNREQFGLGFHLFMWGLFKKVFAADNLGRYIDQTLATPFDAGGAALYWAYLVFSVQIYADFAGYSDMARGTAKMLGFELTVNFRMPNFATTQVNVWARWHLTLTRWVRDYVYIPLGGNQVGSARTTLNRYISMGLIGLWHGANWHFLFWGWLNATWMTLEYAIGPYVRRVIHPATRAGKAFWMLVSWQIFQHIRIMNNGLFRYDNVGVVVEHYRRILTWEPGPVPFTFVFWLEKIGMYLVPLLLLEGYLFVRNDAKALWNSPWPVRAALYFAFFYLMTLYAHDGAQPFYYFQF